MLSEFPEVDLVSFLLCSGIVFEMSTAGLDLYSSEKSTVHDPWSVPDPSSTPVFGNPVGGIMERELLDSCEF